MSPRGYFPTVIGAGIGIGEEAGFKQGCLFLTLFASTVA